MMPNDAEKKIRFVRIEYNSEDAIHGFKFYDKDQALIWGIGATFPQDEAKTVTLADNEVIVGVVCKLHPGSPCAYTDFQFQIASLAQK